MTTYTHIFLNQTRRMVPLSEAAAIVGTIEARASGFLLVDASRVRMDQHGRPCWQTGGWSYGHVQHGHICAGAGGLNSLPVMPIAAAREIA